MVDGLRLSKEELKARFGCSERLSVRLGALQAQDVDVTAAVLEEAGRSRPLEDALLAIPLRGGKSPLDTRRLRACGPGAAGLVVIRQGTRRIIALEEETLAEKAWSRSLAATQPPTSAERASPAELRLSPTDLERAREVLLTSVDPRAKIEAIRKLAHAPHKTGEAGVLILRALEDPEAEVREEAAVAMERLGLNRGLADLVRTVAAGSPRQKVVALQKVAAWASKSGPAERSIVLATLVAHLTFERDEEVLKSLLAALVEYGPLAASRPDAMASLIRTLLRLLADRLDALEGPARTLLEKLGELGGAEAATLLWSETQGIEERSLKVFLLEVLCALRLPASIEAEIADRAATDLATGEMDDLRERRLASTLLLRGNVALRALLRAYPNAREENRAALVSLINAAALGEGVSDSLRNEAGSLLLQAFRSGGTLLRIAIMEAACCWHPRLEAKIKRGLASAFLADLHAHKSHRIHELAAASIRRMGLVVVESLETCIQRSEVPLERETAARILADLAAEAAAHPREAEAIIRFLERQESADRVEAGRLARCIARAATNPKIDAMLVRAIYRRYLVQLETSNHAMDLIASLADLAAAPTCDPGGAAQMALRLLDYLESPLPDPAVREEKTAEGTRLLVGAQTTVYTDYVPELVRGIRNVCLSAQLPDRIRAEAIRRLCERLKAVLGYREIWAPGNLVDLAEALGDIALSNHASASQRRQIVETMLDNLRNLSIIRILGRIFGEGAGDAAEFGALAGAFVTRTTDLLASREYAAIEDQHVLMCALGHAALGKQLGRTKRESEQRRARIVELLISHRDRVRETRALLQRIASLPAAKSLRARIAEVLG